MAATFSDMKVDFDGPELLFVPLGGSGEIGMNFNLYTTGGRWLAIDCGITFDNSDLETRIVMPDPSFIEARRDRLEGLIITHGHEDHVGAVAHLWPRLRCPVYATPFTMALLNRKLQEAGLTDQVPLHTLSRGARLKLGPFDVELVDITHSIPEASAVILRTEHGTVLHTGDWKLDPDPVIGDTTDTVKLQALAREGVLAVVGDSTNAMIEGSTGSESELGPSLHALMAPMKGRVAVSCFASNVARLRTLVEVGRKVGRRPMIVGRSMLNMLQASTKTHYFSRPSDELHPKAFADTPREELLLICTGSQGEANAALARIADGRHRDVWLERGDDVIFSSRVIPGNEASVAGLAARLRRMGVRVTDDTRHLVHVSGHPARDDLRTMYEWVRPRALIPVHGELDHMRAHQQLGQEMGIPDTLVPLNGDVIRIAPGPLARVGEVLVGRLMLDEHGRPPAA